MLKTNTAYRKDIYSTKLATASKIKIIVIEGMKKSLNNRLSECIKEAKKNNLPIDKSVNIDAIKGNDLEGLSDDDCRNILEHLHENKIFHNILNDLGIKSVSKYSFYSNQRATGKLSALIEYLKGDNIEISKNNSVLFHSQNSDHIEQKEDLNNDSNRDYTMTWLDKKNLKNNNTLIDRPVNLKQVSTEILPKLIQDYETSGYAKAVTITVIVNNESITFKSSTTELADQMKNADNNSINTILAAFIQKTEVELLLKTNPNITQTEIEKKYVSKILEKDDNGLPKLKDNSKIQCKIEIQTYTLNQESILKNLSNMRLKYYKNSQQTCLYDAEYLKHIMSNNNKNEFVLSNEDIENANIQIDTGCLQLALIMNNIQSNENGFSLYNVDELKFKYGCQEQKSFEELTNFFMLINQNFPDGCIIRTGKAGNNAGHYVFYHPELGVISGTKDLNNFKSLKQFYKERYNSGMKIDIACFDTILNDYKKLKNLYGE